MNTYREVNNTLLSWQQDIYCNVYNIALYNHFKASPENIGIRNKIEDINICFKESIIKQLDSNQLKEVEGVLVKMRDVFNKYQNLNQEIIIEDEDDVNAFKTNVDNLMNILKNIQGIDMYINLYKEIRDSGEKALQESKKQYEDELQESKKLWEYKYKELIGKITEPTLYSAYQEQADNIKKRIFYNGIAFYSIIALIMCAFPLLGNVEKTSPDELIFYFSTRILITFTAFYLLSFINRSIRDDRKLEQTYRHKEVVSKSYWNYLEFLDNKRQFSDKDNALLIKEKASHIAAESLGLNPALLLEKGSAVKNTEKNDAENPIDLAFKIVDIINKTHKTKDEK